MDARSVLAGGVTWSVPLRSGLRRANTTRSPYHSGLHELLGRKAPPARVTSATEAQAFLNLDPREPVDPAPVGEPNHFHRASCSSGSEPAPQPRARNWREPPVDRPCRYPYSWS